MLFTLVYITCVYLSFYRMLVVDYIFSNSSTALEYGMMAL